MIWQTSRRKIALERPLVMGILNVTPDSFSDGGEFTSVENAVRHAEEMIADGADIIDIGGESTRPGSVQISADEEIARVVPVIAAVADRCNVPISVDTTKSEVAKRAVDAGAEIINDISGLRWDAKMADVAAASRAGLILMHSRGEFSAMHSQTPVDDIVSEVINGLRSSVAAAKDRGVLDAHLVMDIGIGFGKTSDENLEVIAKLDKIVAEFETYPIMAGTSRKSFIGKLTGESAAANRLAGSLTTALLALQKGAHILRVHDVRETVAACRVFSAISERS